MISELGIFMFFVMVSMVAAGGIHLQQEEKHVFAR